MSDAQRAAKDYLDGVIQKQKTLGYRARVSPERYAKSLTELEKVFARMAARKRANGLVTSG